MPTLMPRRPTSGGALAEWVTATVTIQQAFAPASLWRGQAFGRPPAALRTHRTTERLVRLGVEQLDRVPNP